MKPTSAQQQALLSLLSRIYEEIRAIEETYTIYVRPEDFRPRIEYFHDAIRVFTQGGESGFERSGRLSVESLSADVIMLRQITQKPLVRHPDLNIPLSPHTEIVSRPSLHPATTNNRIDVGVAATLGEGYGHYALLFVAMLAYPAERNFMNRINECNNHEEILHDLIAETQPKHMEAQVNEEAMLAGITDPELRHKLMLAVIASKKQRHATNIEMLHVLQKEKESVRQTAAALESAHLHFVSSQLVLYQGAQAIVKKMAQQGLNIVGEFVETAVREAQKGGRGF